MAKIPKGDGTTNTFTEVVRGRRESGQSAYESFFGSVKDKLREKTDVRQILPQGGLLTALFPQLKAYKAGPQKGERLSSPSPASALSGSEPALQSLQMNTMIAAKNSMVLPAIHKDINLMRQNMAKMVKLSGGKAVTRVDKDFFKSKQREEAYKVQTTPKPETAPAAEKEDKKGMFAEILGGLLTSIKEAVNVVKTAIADAISGAISMLVKGLKSAFSLGKIGIRALWPLLGRLLAFFVSPIGLAIIFAAGFLYLLNKWAKPGDENITLGALDPARDPAAQAYQNSGTMDAEAERKAQNNVLANKDIWSKFATPESDSSTLSSIPGLGGRMRESEQQKKFREQFIDPNTGEMLSSPNSGEVIAIGDSIAQGLAKTGKIDFSNTEVGARPIDVLERIQGILAKFPNYFRGKQVVLSTGLSNNTNTSPRMLGLIDKQISLLEEAGAKVSVLGVGTRSDFGKKDLNGELSNIVKKHDASKVTFTGPLSDYGAIGSDQVHATDSAYKALFNKINGGPTQAPAAPVKGRAVDEGSRAASDVPPKVINVLPIPIKEEGEDMDGDSEQHSAISSTYDSSFANYFSKSLAT